MFSEKLDLHRMLGEATQENSPFNETRITNLALLGDTPEEIGERTGELEKHGDSVNTLDQTGPDTGGINTPLQPSPISFLSPVNYKNTSVVQITKGLDLIVDGTCHK